MDYEQIDMNRLLSSRNDPRTPTTVIKVEDADEGTYTERVLPTHGQPLVEEDPTWTGYPLDMHGRITINEATANPFANPFMEADAARGRAYTSNFPDMLRMGINFDAMSSYAGIPLVWRQIAGREMPSNKQQEEYLRDAGMGVAPIVHEGAEYPEAAIDLDDGTIIVNYKRGFKFPVTEEMRRFDQIGKVRDLAQQAGISLALTEEYQMAVLLTTTGNFTRTTADNDEGNNQQTLTMNAENLETALNVLMTMKGKNGVYLGVRPNIMYCAPKALHYAKRLLQSRTLVRTHGATTAEVDGLGELNPFFGIVDTIVSSPYFGSNYEWGLIDNSRNPVVFQRVANAEVRGPVFDEGTDTFWFYPRVWFGLGIKDDRFMFFSDSSTRPTVS